MWPAMSQGMRHGALTIACIELTTVECMDVGNEPWLHG